jgi:hypothetical protein
MKYQAPALEHLQLFPRHQTQQLNQPTPKVTSNQRSIRSPCCKPPQEHQQPTPAALRHQQLM